MSIRRKLKAKVQEQERRYADADQSTGDRSKNKVKGDNDYGDQQAANEGSNLNEDTDRRDIFEQMRDR
jgi:hypothetical protein